jgi:hypothetical protein
MICGKLSAMRPILSVTAYNDTTPYLRELGKELVFFFVLHFHMVKVICCSVLGLFSILH